MHFCTDQKCKKINIGKIFQLKMLLEEARSRKVKFSAMGLFNIDRQLLFSVKISPPANTG
jgi:hypothetical protein